MNLGRPLEFDPEHVLGAAMLTFWSQGYEATSLQDLLKTMGLSKSSLYQAFGGKQQLFERCIHRYRESIAADMLERLDKAASGRQFIAAMLYSVADEARFPEKRRGCLVMNTANEFAQRNPTVARWVAKSIDRFRNIFLTAVKRGQREGDISANKNPDALAGYIVSSMSGLRTMVKAGVDEKTVKATVRVIMTALS